MHLSILEVASVGHFLLCKVVFSETVKSIATESTLVVAAICPLEVSLTIFAVCDEVTLEETSVSLPILFAVTIQGIVEPLTFVSVALLRIFVDSIAVCGVLRPVSLVGFSILVN